MAVGLFESEGLDLVDRVVEVVHASGASFFHQQPAGALSSSLLLQPLLQPLPSQPPAQKHTVLVPVLIKKYITVFKHSIQMTHNAF